MAAAPDVLVERAHELETLAELADEAGRGDGRLVVIEGPPGIGKTRLTAEAAAMTSERGMLVLSACGAELEQEFAFGIARQLFEPLVAGMPPVRRNRVLAGAAGLAAPLLLPEQAGREASPAGELHPLLHGLYWLCANVAAQRPLALVVDDAHWADEASLRWLAYLARRLAGLSTLVVVATRTLEPGSAGSTLDALRNDPGARTLMPASLTVAGVQTVLRAALGTEPQPAFCRACANRTGGNPFLLQHVAQALASDGVTPSEDAAAHVAEVTPEAVSRAVLHRIARLGDPARELARALCVMGPDSELRHTAALAGLQPRQAVEAVELLARAGLVDRTAAPRFVHTILAQAVRSGLSAARLADLHRSAAHLLADDGASAERVAGHLLAADARGEPWAVQALVRAGARSLARGAPTAAIPFLERALREPPEPAARAEVLQLLGMAEVRAGRSSGPARLREAFELIREPAARVQAARAVAHALLHNGEAGEALAVLTAVAEEVRGAIDEELTLLLEGERCSLGLFNPATAEAAVNVAVPLARGLRGTPSGGHLLLGVLAITQGSVGEQGTTLPEAVRTAGRALGHDALAGERIVDAPVLYGVVDTLISAECVDQAERALDQAIAVARSRGSLPSFALASAWRAHARWFRGELREAEADAADALRVARDAGDKLTAPMAAGVLVAALVERGQLDEAETTLIEAGLADALPPDAIAMFFVLYHRGRLRVAQGRAREGLGDLMTLRQLRDLGGWAFAGMQPGVAAAAALVAVGDREPARELVEEELRIARRRAAPPCWEGAALRALASTQDGPTAIETLQASTQVLERSVCLLERARTLLELGAAMRRSNQRAASREPLRRALELTHRCGADPLEQHVRDELRASGGRPRREMLSGVESLTVSELRVARMAARGLTNREIAQGLFVTLKTVEVHLSNAYRKLDISSRRQLPERLGS